MIARPGIRLTVAPGKVWRAQGPCSERALAFAQRFCTALRIDQVFEVNVESCPREHSGLGTGTQLGLAVARGVAAASGYPDLTAPELALHVGRGLRSSLGIHGFDLGGFLVEGGKTTTERIAPLLCRLPFPTAWRILLLQPTHLQGVHGQGEHEAFARLSKTPPDLRHTEALCRLVLLGMLPALVEKNLETFAEALYDFNRRVGELFCTSQGGIYSHPHIDSLVSVFRQEGVRGVAQSSWGPAVFALFPSGLSALEFRNFLARAHNIRTEEMTITKAAIGGAVTSSLDDTP
jgi:beta-RFAP synthase